MGGFLPNLFADPKNGTKNCPKIVQNAHAMYLSVIYLKVVKGEGSWKDRRSRTIYFLAEVRYSPYSWLVFEPMDQPKIL